MNKLILLGLLLLMPFLLGSSWVCYNEKGEIISQYVSINNKPLEKKCIKVPRSVASSNLKNKKVKNNKIVPLTKSEILIREKAKKLKQQKFDIFINNLYNKLIKLGFTDEETTFLLNYSGIRH